MKQRCKTNDGFVVLNADGDLWTPHYFSSESSAKSHISGQEKMYNWNLSNHIVVPAKFTAKWKQQ